MLEGAATIADPRVEKMLQRLQTTRERWYALGREDGERWAVDNATRDQLDFVSRLNSKTNALIPAFVRDGFEQRAVASTFAQKAASDSSAYTDGWYAIVQELWRTVAPALNENTARRAPQDKRGPDRLRQPISGIIAEGIADQADWRREKAGEYPDDPRNLNAADAIVGLADYVRQLPEGDTRLQKLAEFAVVDDVFAPGQELSRDISRFGFDHDRDTADVTVATKHYDAYLDSMVEIAKQDDVEMRRLGGLLTPEEESAYEDS